jgi:hypothetical protein
MLDQARNVIALETDYITAVCGLVPGKATSTWLCVMSDEVMNQWNR